MTNKTKSIEAGKSFRKRMNEAKETDIKNAEQAEWRQDYRKKGWSAAGFEGPEDAITYIKSAWESYRKNNPHLWGDESDESEEGDTD